MEQFRCYEDNFDAIYLCSNCSSMLCPKHYFSHQKNFPDHEIDRMKMPVNNESRQILMNFTIKLKKTLISVIHNIDIDLWANREEYRNLFIKMNFFIEELNLLLLFLTRVHHIPIKIFYTPFEYFLHQTPDKAFKYATEFKIPESFKEFTDEFLEMSLDLASLNASYRANLFFYNYFMFVDKKYVFGWSYYELYDKNCLIMVCLGTLVSVLLASEYEMAYEVLNNLKTLFEICANEAACFWSDISEIINEFIRKRKISELIAKWKYLEIVWSDDVNFSWWLHQLSELLFKGLNRNDLASHYASKNEIHIKKYSPQLLKFYKLALPLSKFNCGDFEFINKWSEKKISMPESYDREYLRFWIGSSILWLTWNAHRGKQINTEKIVKKINKVANSVENKHEFDELLIYLNLIEWNFDDALKMALNLVKLHKKKKYLYFNESMLYSQLGFIYLIQGDFKKAHCFLCIAKSCSGIQWNNYFQANIDYGLGIICIKKRFFKDALNHFECVKKSNNSAIQFLHVNILIGGIHYLMQNYEKSLWYWIKEEKNMINLIPSDNENWYVLYGSFGKLYELNKNSESANHYYNKAIDFLKSKEMLPSIFFGDIVYSYFLRQRDFEKCETILKLKFDIFGILPDKKIAFIPKSIAYIQWLKLLLAQNIIWAANKIFSKLVKLLDIEKRWVLRKKPENEDLLIIFLKFTSIYTFKIKDFYKAEKYCKTIESDLEVNLPINAWYFKKIFRYLLEIYIRQERWIDAKIYNKKLSDLLKTSYLNENYRYTIRLTKTEIKENIRKCKIKTKIIDKHIEISKNSLKSK